MRRKCCICRCRRTRFLYRLTLAGALLFLGQSIKQNLVIPYPMSLNTTIRLHSNDLPRLKQAKEQIKAAADIAKKTQNHEAELVLGLLQNYTAVAAPISWGRAQAISRSSDEPEVGFVSLRPGDEKYGHEWAQPYYDKRMGAEYMPLQRLIVMRYYPCSRFWQGIIVLHEVKHALNHRRWGYPVWGAGFAFWGHQLDGGRAYCQEECNVLAFEHELLESLGGKPYKHYLNKMMARMVREAKRAHKEIGEYFVIPDQYDPELNCLGGPPLSDEEKSCRRIQCWLNACFWLIDDYDVGDPEACKEQLLKGLCQNVGILSK
jgi:hypothetical protein